MQTNNALLKLGITQGDPNGVGMELILKIFSDENIYKYCIPVLYASPKTFTFYKKVLEMEQPMYHLVKSASQGCFSYSSFRQLNRGASLAAIFGTYWTYCSAFWS